MRACRDELIARNLRLVLSVAGRYKPQPGLEFDDLVAEGNFGLAKAAARFDPGRGFRFSTYAVWWIRQAISHAVGHDARAIRVQIGCLKQRALERAGAAPTGGEA